MESGLGIKLCVEKYNLDTLLDFMKEENVINLYFPKSIKKVENFPILGSGKIDYKKLQEIAESKE